MSCRCIDPTKPIWMVMGHLPPEDGRCRTIIVNATDEEDAIHHGKLEGLHTVESVKHITSQQYFCLRFVWFRMVDEGMISDT